MSTRQNCLGIQRTAIALLSLTTSAVCHAAPSATGPDAEVNKIRDQADAAGVAGKFSEAIALWSKVWELRPNDWEVACNIGRGELRRGAYPKAARWLTRCKDLRPRESGGAALQKQKAAALELLTVRQRIAALTVEVEEPDTRVVVDDDSVWVSPIREDVFVEAGEHRLQAFKGLRTAFTKISTVAGKEYRVALVLPRSAPLAREIDFPPWVDPATIPQFRWWPVGVGGGVVATGVIMGGLFAGLSGLSSDNATTQLTLIQTAGGSCVQAPIDPGCAGYEQSNARSSMFSTAAIATFIAAGAIAAGVIGYAIYENHRVSVTVAPTNVGMNLKW